MKKEKRTSLLALLFIAILALCLSNTFAAPQLRLSDGTVAGTKIITDQSPEDSDPTPGKVSYVGGVGANWDISLYSGLTKPMLGSGLLPTIDLGCLPSSQAGGVLTIQFTETGFLAPGAALAQFASVIDGTVTYKVWADSANASFGKTTLVTTLGPFAPGTASGEDVGTVGLGAPYSLTAEMIINHPARGVSGFNAFFRVHPSEGGCRVTGGSNRQLNSSQSACITTPLPTHVSHGGQVGAPFSVETPFTPNSLCIRGEWQHNRHLTGNSLVGVFHAAGNGNKHQFDSLLCACLPCDENPGSVGVVGGICNHGDRVCGPEPRRAPANKICFSGVGDYTFTSGNKTVKAVFRVDIEDRSEGNSHSSTPPADRYRIRLWILDPSCGRNPDPNSAEAMAIRFAASADPTKIASLATTEDLKVNIAPDIDDGGDMTQGNHQIHPETGATCNSVVLAAPARLDASIQVALLTQSGPGPFGLVAQGYQNTQNPTFIYRSTIRNSGSVPLSNLSVFTVTDSIMDTTSLYAAPGTILQPGGTLTREHTATLDTDTVNSVIVSATSSADGTPAIGSGSAAVALVALAGPTGVDARVVGKKITLSWNALAGASAYNIKRALTSGGPYTTVGTGFTSTSYSDAAVVKGTTYYYVVSAIKAGAETVNSAQVSAMIEDSPSKPGRPR